MCVFNIIGSLFFDNIIGTTKEQTITNWSISMKLSASTTTKLPYLLWDGESIHSKKNSFKYEHNRQINQNLLLIKCGIPIPKRWIVDVVLRAINIYDIQESRMKRRKKKFGGENHASQFEWSSIWLFAFFLSLSSVGGLNAMGSTKSRINYGFWSNQANWSTGTHNQ